MPPVSISPAAPQVISRTSTAIPLRGIGGAVLLWAALACAAAPAARALPMSYAGSTTVGLDVDPHWSSTWFSHAVDRRNGVGLSLQYLPANGSHPSHAASADGAGSHARQGDETFALVDVTRLVHRWNLPRAQANVWLFGGVGTYHASGTSAIGLSHGSQRHDHGDDQPATGPALRLAARPGIQIDAETTRLRVEGRAMLFLASGIQRPLLSATAGAALTEPHYNGVQPWLELQVRAMPGVVDQLELIPKLRLLHHRLVLDVGYSSLGSVVGGLTVTF